MPTRPQRFRRGETAAAAYIQTCSSRRGAILALRFGFDRHRIGDDAQLLKKLAAEFSTELPPGSWLHRRLRELGDHE